MKYDWSVINKWQHDLMVEHAEDMAERARQSYEASKQILAMKGPFKLILLKTSDHIATDPTELLEYYPARREEVKKKPVLKPRSLGASTSVFAKGRQDGFSRSLKECRREGSIEGLGDPWPEEAVKEAADQLRQEIDRRCMEYARSLVVNELVAAKKRGTKKKVKK